MQLEFKESFIKDLKKVEYSVQLKVKLLVEEIKQADSLNTIAHVKKLKSESIYYRIRIGDYRLGFKLENNKIVLIRFLHRKEMYRYFP
jgi:mRNA interferase RelE/StbE